MKLTKLHLLSAILTSSLLVGCASTSSTDDSAADEQARMEAQSAAAAAAATQVAADTAARAAEQARIDTEMANLVSVFYFDFDQATLSSATRAALDAQVAMLRNSSANVRLEGHADERGTREYNMALGERRAKAIGDYLSLNGISRARVEAISYGEERPLSDGSSEMSYSQNRRVELK